MRNCASYLVFAAALASTGSVVAASSQTNHTTFAQPGNGAITIPPGVARGYGNYPDGTPCVGTPKDPTAFPDKKTNPCDGKPLSPERLPGQYPPVVAPPVNVTAPGGQTVPELKPETDHRAGQFAPYEDGTPCVGRPKDLFRRPNKETNPCVPVEETSPSEPNGNHTPITSEKEGTGAGGTNIAPSYTREPRPDFRGVPTIKQRPDGSLYIEYPDKPTDKPVYDKPRGPAVRPQEKQSSEQGWQDRGLLLSSADKPTPYLPPFTALRPAGEVTDVTPENQHPIAVQLQNSKRPVFRLFYSSKDPRSQNMSAWLDRAAKANPAVVFLRLDATKVFVTKRAPSVTLDIPRPARAFSQTGYRTDAELDKFLRDGLSRWTPVTHQRP
jgi:hypothetical protein